MATKPSSLKLSELLKPHAKARTVGLVAVIGVLEPWPLKIVIDNVLKSQPIHGWLPNKGDIEFEHVDFSYQADRPILRDVNLRVEPGQVAALVGSHGRGQDYHHQPDSALLRSDLRRGQDRRHRCPALPDAVPGDAAVSRSWNNIAYGKPGASKAEILRAAELANAHEFIAKMPQGYDTMIGERGANLSGGQRRRICHCPRHHSPHRF
jgi:ABC-type multidrug transport system fused ATPase/permease subunit